MSESAENMNLNAAGETISSIVNNQLAPDITAAILDGFTGVQQRLEQCLPPDEVAAQGLRSALEAARSSMIQASEAQESARNGLNEYLHRIGWSDSSQEASRADEQSAPAAEQSAPAFRERSNSRNPYFAHGIDGTFKPRDPITRELLKPGEIPKSLLDDPELKAGFDFWREHGSEIDVRLLMPGYGSISSQIDLQSEAQRLGRVDGVLFMSIIMSAKDAERAKRLYNDASHSVQGQGRSSVFVRPDDPGTEVLIDTVPQIKGTNVDIEFPDYREGTTRPADTALTGWYIAESGVYSDSPGEHDPSGIHKTTVFGVLSAGSITYRNLYMIGRMGAELQRRQEQSGKTPNAVSLVVGQLHGGIQDVLNGYGAKVTATGPKPGKLVDTLRDCARRCELTPRDIENLNKAILEEFLGFK